MKKTTIKSLVIVVIPVIVLLGASVYLLNKIPQVRFGIAKYVANYSIERSARQGKISQSGANQIKQAINRLFEARKKLENKGVEEKRIEEEILEFIASEKFQRISSADKLSDEEVKKVVSFLNRMTQVLEELAKNSAVDSQ